MDSFSKLAGKFQIGGTSFTPHQVGVFRIGHGAANGLFHAFLGFVETFCSTFTCQERLVVFVVVAGQQVSSFCIGTCNDQCRHAANVSSHAGCDEFLASFSGRHQHFAAHVTALFDRSQLVFKVNATSTRRDHGFHQFEGVQHTAKAGFGIGHDRREVICVIFVARVGAFRPLNFVGTAEAVVDALNHLWHGIHWIQRLVGVHGSVRVVVGSNLPARQVDGFDASLDLLHGLTTGQCAQAVDVVFCVQQIPQLFCTTASQGVLNGERTAQTDHVCC